jgi:dienelactone hydrolase
MKATLATKRSRLWLRWAWAPVLCILAGTLSAADAAGVRVLPADKRPADQRLEKLKDLNGYFPFTPPKSRDEWDRRAERVRRQMLVALGLWPMPSKTPLNAVVHGGRDQGDYTVEKAFFESFPGFFVTGNLYRPKGKSGPLPGVLCPHGHWANGRFYDVGVDGVRKQIVQGAERFENGGRSPLQARCVQLARMGCVVFHYDMIGYADSTQISQGLAHGFAKQRPEMNTVENWGLFSPAAESHLQSVMGMQAYNSFRALDFLLDLPDVDPQRIAVTGASGGGTQTFVLSALDPRVAVSVPAVMVSTAMQGGCTCENCSLLRVGTGNVEFAALFAPKPLCLLSADDWTKEMPTKGFPQLQEHYRLLGAEKNVQHNPLLHFEHNYNYVSRAKMYAWLNEHFKLGLPTPIVEEDYPRLNAAELTVWDDAHPKPQGGDDFERRVLRWWNDDAQTQLAQIVPSDAATWQRYREVVGGGVDVVLGAGLPDGGEVRFEATATTEQDGFRTVAGLLRNAAQGSELPLVMLEPKTAGPRVAVWLSRDGKAGLFAADGKPQTAVSRLLDAGVTVVGADLIYQGEFLADGQPLDKTRRVENPREAAAYTFGYNPAVFAQRVQDVSSVICFAGSRQAGAAVLLAGLDGAGPWAAAALALADGAVAKAAVDLGGFRFGKVLDIHSPDFLPGGAKYFDLPGMAALAAPTPLWIADEGAETPAVVAAAYRAAGTPQALTAGAGEASKRTDDAVDWLLK